MDSDCDLYLVFDNTLPYGNVLVCLFMLVLFMLTQRQNLQFIKCLTKVQRKRPSVNYAKDWLGQLFLIPGLIPWHEKGIAYGCDHYGAVNNHFPVYLVIFGMLTLKRTTKEFFTLILFLKK